MDMLFSEPITPFALSLPRAVLDNNVIVKSVIWAPTSVVGNGSEHFLEVYGLFVLPLL